MARAAQRTNVYGLGARDLAELEELAPEPGYRARQVAHELYRRDSLEPSRWLTLPRSLRERLAKAYVIERPAIAGRQTSVDGSVKCVMALPGGGEVESVAMPADGRMTLCISSQAGCAFGCAFCMTARLGFVRHLSAGEIVGQVAALLAETGAERGRYNIVFMGMGEPLHNADNVLDALRLLTDEHGFGLGPRRITVSTVGLPGGIVRLADEGPPVRLAVSLVCADEAVRASLMPVARRYSLDDLADAIRHFGRGRRDRPTLEVVLLEGINDLPEHADKLVDFARRSAAKVNLIEFNETDELPYRSSGEETIQSFLSVLSRARVAGTVRRSRGRDISGACGQLALRRSST